MAHFEKQYSEIYDTLYSQKNYEKELDFIFNQINKNKKEIKDILELGCGTGEYTKLLLKKKYDVTAVDLSNSMMQIAKKKLSKKVKLITEDMINLKLKKKFDIVASFFDVVSYFKKKNDLNYFLKNSNYNLKKDGLLIFDFWNKDGIFNLKPRQRIKFYKRKDNELIKFSNPIWSKKNENISVYTKIIELNKKLKSYSVINETHKMRYYDLKKIKSKLKKNNFKFIKWFDILNNDKILKNSWSIFVLARKIK